MSPAWPFDPLRPLSAQVIVADPPWLFKVRSDKGGLKSGQAHYDCMPLAEIKALPVNQLARADCWLFLWTSAPMLREGFDVLDAWGFRYSTRVSWRKVYPSGKSRMGTGYVARSFHEDVLVGRIGEPMRRKPFDGLFAGVAREHSRKPEEFYQRVEAFAPKSFCVELFARQSRPGWLSWGNEATKFDEEAAA